MKSGSSFHLTDPWAADLLYQSAQISPRLGFGTGITQTRQTAGHDPEPHQNRSGLEGRKGLGRKPSRVPVRALHPPH